MSNVALLQNVIDQTVDIVNQVSPDELGRPSPCADWTVRDVINHITAGATIFAISAEQGSVPDDELGRLMGGDNVGNDPQGAWATASRRAMDAFRQPGAMDKIVKLPFGEMPAGVALDIAIFDVATHACDIAHATGRTVTDTELLEAALAMGQQMVGPELRAPGIFDDEQPAAASASPQDKLLAFAGRKV